MPYIAPEVITEAKRMDLLTYLRTYEPGQLVRVSGNTYCTREHDSLKISNGKWMWWSRGIGGRTALDYLIKVKELSFIEAVETIMGNCAVTALVYETESRSYEEQPLLLPQKSPTSDVVTQYLFGRGIDYEIINECLDKELIIESLPYHNVVFIGYDDKKEAKYAAYRATNKSRIMGDCTGSKKQYSFRLTNENSTEVHLFECAIDLLSFATLAKIEGEDWRKLNLVSLSGVYSPKQEMEKSFCFGYSNIYGPTSEEAAEACENFGEKEFKERNLTKFDHKYERVLKHLENHETVMLRLEYAGCGMTKNYGAETVYIETDEDGPLKNGDIISLSTEDSNRIRESYKKHVQDLRQAFEKRLDTYLEKYGVSKIRKWTYWADE